MQLHKCGISKDQRQRANQPHRNSQFDGAQYRMKTQPGGDIGLFVAAEAGYAAAAAKKPEPPVPMPRLTYPILAVLFFAAVFVPFLT